MITTDSVCDLPEVLKEKLHITVCPYYVCTEQGRFLDEKELTAQMASIFIDKVFLLDGKKVEVILNFKDEYKNLYSHMGQVWGAEERKSN